MAAQERLIAALRRGALRAADGTQARLVETHISYVLLTGRYAYKIKKAVATGFLDFTTLAARRFFCEQELRLNRRLAPALYLDVVTIGGTPDAPVLDDGGAPLEYAVRMREFPQSALASAALARGELSGETIDALAAAIAAFHADAARAPGEGALATPRVILGLARRNFREIAPFVTGADDRGALAVVARWTRHEAAARRRAFGERLRDGFVRECHGDLHLGNVALIAGEVTIFDCIEFSDAMRWIDVMSEVAFTFMDLRHHSRPDLAHRLLNGYLEATGDYRGLTVLRFYVVYRAMVRAKVALLRAQQLAPGDEHAASIAAFRGCLSLAYESAAAPAPAVVLMHGLAGAGKTTIAQHLLEAIGAIRIRTDVERRRMPSGYSRGDSGTGVGRGDYSPEATRATYERVRELAADVVDAGHVVLVDAAFLARWQRDMFRDLARKRAVPLVIVDCVAPEAVLRERVALRREAGRDASEADEAVLDFQLRTRQPLADDEASTVVTCTTVATDGSPAIAGHVARDAPGAGRIQVLERVRAAVRAGSSS